MLLPCPWLPCWLHGDAITWHLKRLGPQMDRFQHSWLIKSTHCTCERIPRHGIREETIQQTNKTLTADPSHRHGDGLHDKVHTENEGLEQQDKSPILAEHRRRKRTFVDVLFCCLTSFPATCWSTCRLRPHSDGGKDMTVTFSNPKWVCYFLLTPYSVRLFWKPRDRPIWRLWSGRCCL